MACLLDRPWIWHVSLILQVSLISTFKVVQNFIFECHRVSPGTFQLLFGNQLHGGSSLQFLVWKVTLVWLALGFVGFQLFLVEVPIVHALGNLVPVLQTNCLSLCPQYYHQPPKYSKYFPPPSTYYSRSHPFPLASTHSSVANMGLFASVLIW